MPRHRDYKPVDVEISRIRSLFHLPIEEAAKKCGICTTLLKRMCRRKGISRWPYRKLKSLSRMIEMLEQEGGADQKSGKRLQTLRDEVAAIKSGADESATSPRDSLVPSSPASSPTHTGMFPVPTSYVPSATVYQLPTSAQHSFRPPAALVTSGAWHAPAAPYYTLDSFVASHQGSHAKQVAASFSVPHASHVQQVQLRRPLPPHAPTCMAMPYTTQLPTWHQPVKVQEKRRSQVEAASSLAGLCSAAAGSAPPHERLPSIHHLLAQVAPL